MIDNKIAKLEQQLEAIKTEIEKLKAKETDKNIEPWRANLNEYYFAIGSNGNILNSSEKNHRWDNERYSFGNYYRTQELIEQDIEELAIRNRTRQLRDELCEGYTFRPEEGNWYVYFDTDIMEYATNFELSSKRIGSIYFDTQEHAQMACDVLNRKDTNV